MRATYTESAGGNPILTLAEVRVYAEHFWAEHQRALARRNQIILVVPGRCSQGRDWVAQLHPELQRVCRIIVMPPQLMGYGPEHVLAVQRVGDWWESEIFRDEVSRAYLEWLDPKTREIFLRDGMLREPQRDNRDEIRVRLYGEFAAAPMLWRQPPDHLNFRCTLVPTPLRAKVTGTVRCEARLR